MCVYVNAGRVMKVTSMHTQLIYMYIHVVTAW